MDGHEQYRLGCPIWSCPQWRGSVYRHKSPRADWLREYSQTFSTVEGNSTFYGIPSLDTFRRWADQTVDGFRFALKFPRAISHERRLIGAEAETDAFLEGLGVLHDAQRLGPSFIQLPPTFSPTQFSSLKSYLLSLPVQFPYAVEVRHPDFFQPGPENELQALLSELKIDRVIFDSRPLFSSPPGDEMEEVSQKRKPRLPISRSTSGGHPLLRLVGRNQVAESDPWIEEWTEHIVAWIGAGLKPFVFAHTPDDQYAPEFAERFHRAMERKLKLKPLRFKSAAREQQKTLF